MNDSQRIDELKKYLNLSANALAKALKLKTPQIFYDIKVGKCGISKDLSRKIQEKYFDVNISWLLTGEGEMLKSTQKIENVNNSTIVGANVNGNGNKITHYASEYDACQKEVEHLKAIIEEKEKIIVEKERLITILLKHGTTNYSE